jgi:hypothetical protein
MALDMSLNQFQLPSFTNSGSQTFISNYDTFVSLDDINDDLVEINSGTETVKSTDGNTTYVSGTDYEMDYTNASIKVLSTGSMSDSTEYDISCDFIDSTNYIAHINVVGNIMAVTSLDNKIRIYDVTDNSNPSLIKIIDNPSLDLNKFSDFHMDENILITGGADGYVVIYDISDPSNPYIINELTGLQSNGRLLSFLYEDGILFIGGYSLISVYEASDLNNLSLLSTITDAGTVYDIKKDGDILHNANYSSWLIYDISDLSNITEINKIKDHTNSYVSSVIQQSSDITLTSSGYGSLLIYDTTDINNINKLSEISDDGPGPTQDMVLSENLLFTVTSYGWFVIYDISDPSNPLKINSEIVYGIGSITTVSIKDNKITLASDDGYVSIFDISRFQNDFIDITYADFPEIKFRGNPLKTDNTITEIEVYVNETLQNTYTTNLDQIKSETINEVDLVSGDNWITILGYDDQGNESAATVLISSDYYSATNFEYDQENYRFMMPDDKLHAEAAWGKHDVGFITDGIRFFLDRSIIEQIPVISNASSGDNTLQLKRIGRVETEVVN